MSWLKEQYDWDPPGQEVMAGMTKCPACRRPVHGDMLQDISVLPSAARPRRLQQATVACDSCRATLFREGHVTPADLLRLQGAPEAACQRLEQKQPERPGMGRHTILLDQRRGGLRP